MNTHLAAQNVVQTLCGWWRQRQETNRQLDEIEALTETELSDVAADCGMSVHDLLAVVKAGPHGADEMKQLMKALNIDGDAVEAADIRLYRDMAATCAECGSKDQCRRDLKNGAAAADYVHYCANAGNINELRARPDMLAE